ncbi:IS3 family transposase [Enterococcus termitis]
MTLLHMGILMNRKKVQRLMRKFNLFCPIRKPNPCRLFVFRIICK